MSKLVADPASIVPGYFLIVEIRLTSPISVDLVVLFAQASLEQLVLALRAQIQRDAKLAVRHIIRRVSAFWHDSSRTSGLFFVWPPSRFRHYLISNPERLIVQGR